MTEEPERIKRFYKTVTVEPADGGFGILLDGRQARTMTRKLLIASSRNLAEAITGEWDAQGEFIDRPSMPLTGLLSASIDGGGEGAREWHDEILNYLGSDLLCYRAEEPRALVERQQQAWDPFIDWIRMEFGAALVTTAGIMAIKQPEAARAPIEKAIKDLPRPMLFALYIATGITGSAILALALWKRAFGTDIIFEASRLDEQFQEERWGEDAEAKARAESLRRDFGAVARFLELL